jgi:hypothetical protein
MSLTPESAVTQTAPETIAAAPKRSRQWWLFLFIVLTLGIGGFLIVFPWLDTWDFNSIQDFIPGAAQIWDEPSFRGALTGLGFVNLYIAAAQFVRFARRKY